jgi:FKBP-type peptidyl-prolyl cis-trans isomerase FklB
MNKSISQILCSIIIAATISVGALAQGAKKVAPKPKPKPVPVVITEKYVTINPTTSPLKMSEIDSVSYAIGVNIGQSFKSQGLTNINLEEVKKGMKEMLAGNPTINEQMCGQIIQSYMSKAMEVKGREGRQIGEKFLAENKSKPGVITTASGLQYQVITAGTGEKPTKESKVKVHYHGTLPTGEVFDSSVNRGQPAEFGVTQVIAGWTEALQLMPVGSKYKLFIPYTLAYGERGAGGQIGPYAALVFDVELLEIVK